MIKLSKIYEDLKYAHTNIDSIEDDEYEIGLLDESLEMDKSKIKSYLAVSAYDNTEMAYQYLMDLISELKKLPSIIKLFRVVFLENVNQLNKNEIGSHYVLKKSDLSNSHQIIPHKGVSGDSYILTIKAEKKNVDFNNTILHNMEFPNEKEITLLNKGKGVKLINIEPFLGQDEIDLGGIEKNYFDYEEY